MEVEQYAFFHPTYFIVCGATQTGQSTFVKNLLVNSKTLIRPAPPKTIRPKVIYLFFKIWQPLYNEMKENGTVTHFIKYIPEMSELVELLKKECK